MAHNPGYWGSESPYGKRLTEARLGRLLNQATNSTSTRPDSHGQRRSEPGRPSRPTSCRPIQAYLCSVKCTFAIQDHQSLRHHHPASNTVGTGPLTSMTGQEFSPPRLRTWAGGNRVARHGALRRRPGPGQPVAGKDGREPRHVTGGHSGRSPKVSRRRLGTGDSSPAA